MTDAHRPVPDPGRDPAGSGEPSSPGTESYPLEVPSDERPLGADPPAPWPPCPACGAPRRLPEPVCLQCGHDERPRSGSALPAVAAPDAPGPPVDASGAGSPAAPRPADAVAGADSGTPEHDEDAGGPVDAPDLDRDAELEPLLRPWPGGERLPWIAAGLLLVVLALVGLSTNAAFPPGMVGADDAVGLLERLRLTVRLLAAAGVWALAAWAACLTLAWGEDRPVGGRVALGGRMLLAATASRLALALPIADPLAAFVVEGLLVLLLLAGGLWAATRLGPLAAAVLSAATGLLVGSVALAASLLAWTLA